MTRRVLLLAALAAAPAASAQITIARADVAALYGASSTLSLFEADSSAATRAALGRIAARTGGAQTWTFTGLAFAPAGTVTQTPVRAPQPGSSDPHFASATHIVRTTTDDPAAPAATAYFRLSDTAFEALGSVVADPDGALTLKFVPGLRQPLPYTFGQSWASENAVVLDPSPVPGEQSTRHESTVAGWGTLVTPAGSAPALMVRTLTISRSRFVIPGLPPVVTVDSSRSVEFVTRGHLGASISLDDEGAATGGTYSAGKTGTGAGGDVLAGGGPAGDGLAGALSVGPNPASGTVRIRLGSAIPDGATVTVVDALGRTVAVLATDRPARTEGVLTWDASGVPAGVYAVRVRAGAAQAAHLVVVVH